MKNILIFSAFFYSILTFQASAGVFTNKDVISLSKTMAAHKKYPYMRTTGIIIVDGNFVGTGIMLNENTVLTAAHLFVEKQHTENSYFVLSTKITQKSIPNSQEINYSDITAQIQGRSSSYDVIFHPQFQLIPHNLDRVTNFLQSNRTFEKNNETIEMLGPDLAILKLHSSLNLKTIYPDENIPFLNLISSIQSLKDSTAYILGYGSRYADHEKEFDKEFHFDKSNGVMNLEFNKSFFTQKISYNQEDDLIVSSFNPESNSFLPINSYSKDNPKYYAGYLTSGDSGGPLLTRENGKWIIAGINSRSVYDPHGIINRADSLFNQFQIITPSFLQSTLYQTYAPITDENAKWITSNL